MKAIAYNPYHYHGICISGRSFKLTPERLARHRFMIDTVLDETPFLHRTVHHMWGWRNLRSELQVHVTTNEVKTTSKVIGFVGVSALQRKEPN